MSQPTSAKAQRRVNPWVVMAFIAIPVFVGSLDLTVVSAFLPELIAELGLPFDTGLDDASWVVTSYLLAYTISLTFVGRVSDLMGRRWVYVACLLVFIVGSVIVAVAQQAPTDLLLSIYRRLGERPDPAYVRLQVIVFGRVIEALGAGALVPVSLALVGDLFPPEKRARPLGLVAAMDTLGWVLGPVYGAIFLQIMPWQGLFWMNVPLTLLALLLVLYALRHVPQIRVQGRFDYLGTVFIVGALTCLSLGLGGNVNFAAFDAGIENLSPLPDYAGPVLALGMIFFLLFIVVETRVRDPLLKLGMFLRRNLTAGALVNLFVGYALFIGLVSVPILVNVRGGDINELTATALEVGLLLATLTIPMSIMAFVGGVISERTSLRATVLAGLLIAIVGFGLMWQTWTLDVSNVMIGISMVLAGMGIGMTFSPVSIAIINSAYDDERGVASALVIILRLIGMTLSVSSLTTFALVRVSVVSQAAQSSAITDGQLDVGAFATLYSESVAQVVAEMGLIGAIVCAVAMIPALFLTDTVSVPARDGDSSS